MDKELREAKMKDPFDKTFMYKMYQETFTISKLTTLKEFHE
jgi:hypothetical protein